MAEMKKRFLDYAGLSKFWTIIDTKFAPKVDAAKYGSFNIPTTDTTTIKNKLDVVYENVAGDATSFIIPGASVDHAGLLSADHYDLIDKIDDKINAAAPFHGLLLDGTEVALNAKRADIGLVFRPTGSGNDRQAFIDLVDNSYPTSGTWEEITETEYTANQLKKNYISYQPNSGSPVQYWKWSVDDVEGPTNNLGMPLRQKAISSIDVSELVKAGLLQSADVVINPAGQADGTYLELVFITTGDGTDADSTSTTTVYINVSDLVDVYNAGEGINITQGTITDADDDDLPRTSTIVLKKSTNTELGGIRTGFTTDATKQLYKVELTVDPQNSSNDAQAYVAVPWEHHNVVVKTPKAADGTSEGADNLNAKNQPYLIITDASSSETDANGIKTNDHVFEIKVGEGLKNAETYAQTSVQDVKVGDVDETVESTTDKKISKDAYLVTLVEQKDWGKDVTVDLTDSAKASLALADASVQDVKTGNVTSRDVDAELTPGGDDLEVSLVLSDNDGTDYDGSKGKKAIKVTLGDKTVASLNKADTALQSIDMMGTTLSISKTGESNHIYTAAMATKAMSLGTAANVNTVDAIPDVAATDENIDSFKSDVLKPDGTNEARLNVATTYAVKKYVDEENASQTQDLQNFTTARINELDTVSDAEHDPSKPETSHKHIVTGTEAGAYGATYDEEYGTSATAKQVLVQVGQTDGVLDQSKCVAYTLGIKDIADFRPITDAEIDAICSPGAGA